MGIDYEIHIFNSQIYEIEAIKTGSNESDSFEEVIIKRKDGAMFEKGVDPNSDYQEDLEYKEDTKPNEINQFQRTFYGVNSLKWYHVSFVRKWKETDYKHFFDKYKCSAGPELYTYQITDKDSVIVLVVYT